MEQREFLPLSGLRHEIHNLTLLKRATGLSPPEDEMLHKLESQEIEIPEQSE